MTLSKMEHCAIRWLLLTILVHNGLCCGRAEIGKQYTIRSSLDPVCGYDNGGMWKRSANEIMWTGPAGLIYDSSSGNLNPSRYSASETGLTILKVTQSDAGIYEHTVGTCRPYICTLSVYSKETTSSPSSVFRTTTCESLTLSENQLRTKCTTNEVYPQPKCQFTLQNGAIDKRVINDGSSYITYSYATYESAACTLQHPVAGFKPGDWTVHVKIYTASPGSSSKLEVSRTSFSTLTLSVPTVRIDNCPIGLPGEENTNVRHGYIRQGKTASCECIRVKDGNPRGAVSWSSMHGGSFVGLSLSESAIKIQISSPGTFNCQSKSVLDGSHSISYTPKYAYGPISASLTFNPSGPIYKCPNQQTKVDITCQVPANSSNPAPLFTIRDGDNKSIVNKATGDTALSKSVNYGFTKSGQHAFTCQVENDVFSDMFSDAPVNTIQVYEPPRDPPMIFARGHQNGDMLVEGDDVTVTCGVSGGYPSVHSVTLTCGQDMSVTTNKTSSTLSLNKIGLSYNETNCTCQAAHVTGCYDLMGILTLNVHLSSTEIREHDDSIQLTTGELAGVLVGSMVILVVLVAAIALIVFFIRRKKAKAKQRNKDKEYDEIEKPHIYHIMKPQEPTVLSGKPSSETPGLNSESTVQETEQPNNQSSGKYIEPIDPDLSAYSEVKIDGME